MNASTNAPTDEVHTALGRLHVECEGSGPPAVLWHSLFVDSSTWYRLRSTLAQHRRLILIDGPSHGRSAPLGRMCTLDECVQSAVEVLDQLEVSTPVDWVGNAWGGHVGTLFAARHPQRCRTLATIATPVAALSRAERRKIVPMVRTYRLVGPVRPLVRAVSKVLLGPEAISADPHSAELVEGAFHDADRTGMYRAMESVMLHRQSLARHLSNVDAPTVLLVADADVGFTPPQARGAASQMPRAAVRVVRGQGHIAPLVIDADTVADTITGLWQDPAATIADVGV